MNKKEKENYLLLYGGNNKNKNIFNVGDKIKQTHGSNSSGSIILNGGTEEYEFVGYKGDLALLKSLNEAAKFAFDTVNPRILYDSIMAGYKPALGSITRLHYKFLDRFSKIN
jgi:hypothetical protein